MMRVKTPVDVFRVSELCSCGGEFRLTGVQTLNLPTIYKHGCNLCGKVQEFEEVYPKIVYEAK